jgi:uncharacterized membrane protein
MPKMTLAGHPLHPQIIPFPAALMPTSLVLDVLHLATGRQSYDDAARYTLTGGILGAAAAGTVGAMDYLAIPTGGATKRTANVHAAMNVALMGIFGMSWLMRRGQRTSPMAVALSAVGNVGLLASAWYGGHLVYSHGMRVEGSDPSTGPEIRAPGDVALERALSSVSLRASASGPTDSARTNAGNGAVPAYDLAGSSSAGVTGG